MRPINNNPIIQLRHVIKHESFSVESNIFWSDKVPGNCKGKRSWAQALVGFLVVKGTFAHPSPFTIDLTLGI